MAKHPAVAACAVIASRIRSVEIRSISIRSRWVKGRPRGLSGLTAIRAGLPPRRGPGPHVIGCGEDLKVHQALLRAPARSAAVTLIAMVTRR